MARSGSLGNFFDRCYNLNKYKYTSPTPKVESDFFLDTIWSVYYIIHMKSSFGKYIREKREILLQQDSKFSLRQVAKRIGVEPSYLSKLERGEQTSLSEGKITTLANELAEDPDVLLALTGKISRDIQEIIRKRPQLFAQLIRDLKEIPDHAVLKIVREVRDGKW